MKKIIIITSVIALIAGAAYYGMSRPKAVAQSNDVVIPELTDLGIKGETAFNGTCAACHGINLAGTDNGPSFLNRVYVAGHHGDIAFVLAAKRGASQHHWRFGDMPPQPQVSDEDLVAIIAYVREFQAVNGF